MNGGFTIALTMLGLVFAGHAQATQPRYRVTELTSEIDGISASVATGINDNGDVVGVSSTDAGSRGFVWSTTSGTRLLDPASEMYEGSLATSINNDGAIVGDRLYRTNDPYGPTTNNQASVWFPSGTVTDIGKPVGTRFSQGVDINDNGQVLVSANGAYIWTEQGGFVDLGRLDGNISPTSTVPRSINALGQVVGSSQTSQGTRPFLWSESTGMVEIAPIVGTATDINNSGQVVGHFATSSRERVFVWSAADGMTALAGIPEGGGYMGGNYISTAINDAGSVVGFIDRPAAIVFLWTADEGMTELSALIDPLDPWLARGMTLDKVLDINERGQIVGSALRDGVLHAVLLSPVPEANTFYLLGAGLVLVLSSARRRGRIAPVMNGSIDAV